MPDAPNARWGTDGTMAWTIEDGWVWVFDLIDHHSAEAWRMWLRSAVGSPPCNRSMTRCSTGTDSSSPNLARGTEVRHDWGSQYQSAHFTGSLSWLGLTDSPAFPGEPERNGCAER